MSKGCKVCVTGGAGYIGSWLVKKLLDNGYVVHATLRNLDDESKTGLLKSLAGADTRLFLFEGDIYEADGYEAAIQGCEFVFLVATPLQHNPQSSKYQSTTEAAVAGVRSILKFCEHSGSVKRVIYTGSVTATSPLKEDGNGFNHTIDESCWTPLNLSFSHCEDHEKDYTSSKTLAEKEALSYNNMKAGKERMEVVSLACGLVGGDTLLSYLPSSLRVVLAHITGEELYYRQLEFLQGLLGSVPLVHVDDVCEAHIFCMEKPSMAGRFLCAVGYPIIVDISEYYACKHPQMQVNKWVAEPTKRPIKYTSKKLENLGFKYKYGVEQILDDSVESLKRLGIN
ncbi:hypothetical protein J5N97_028116 [Dioscorea zingiberensis]|uniref:NAD-dependent epimerase/dehydratase domain-containing protein n=1 Tax=Dioscorea zingiberensis TaxID=325984 RepID=A0A9D5BYI3_9LILI|nr:hypothetical protein J5N97_028116 [Dioscorea zingiberensis]